MLQVTFPTMFRQALYPLKPLAPRLFTAGLGLSSLYIVNKFGPRIRNDSIAYTQREPPYVVQQQAHRQRRLNYQHLAVGSFLGLFTGYVLGKLSKLLTLVAVSSLLFIQFLESRGIIHVYDRPTVTKLYRFARDHLHISEFLLDRPSFKISFLLSTGVAAFNS